MAYRRQRSWLSGNACGNRPGASVWACPGFPRRERTLPGPVSAFLDVAAGVGSIVSYIVLPRERAVLSFAAVTVLSVVALAMAPGWRYVGWMLAAVLAAGGGALWLGAPEERPEPGSVVITQPAAGEPVPPCSRVEVHVRGDAPPDGWAWAVAQRDDQDQRYYFEPLRQVGETWTADISIFTTDLHLWVVAADGAQLRYLSTTTDELAATWWSSPDWPPESVLLYDQPNPPLGEPPDEGPEEA